MKRVRLALVGLLAAAALSACVRPSVRNPAPLQLGDRVRVSTASAAGRVVGSLVSLSDSDLVVGLEGKRSARLFRRDVRRVEISTGTRGNAASGARIGAVVGLAGGIVWGLSTPMRCNWGSSGLFSLGTIQCLSNIGGRSGWVLIHGMFGGAAGGMLGGSLGWLVRTESWQAVPLRPSAVVTGLSGGRVGFGASFSF
jgi:hypothetical protein